MQNVLKNKHVYGKILFWFEAVTVSQHIRARFRLLRLLGLIMMYLDVNCKKLFLFIIILIQV